jgi:hypothetical protein
VEAWLARAAGQVLGLNPGAEVEVGRPLQELGLDSLMAVELKSVVERGIDGNLSATLLFDYPTIEALAGYLTREELADEEAPLPPAGAAFVNAADDPGNADPAQTETLDKLERLSEGEAESLLEELLSGLYEEEPA